MRATHTYKRYTYYLIPILLFAVLLLGMVFTLSSTYAAESFSYITADITYDGTVQDAVVLPNTGSELPSSLVYRGGAAYNYSFKLYRSSDGTDWTACPPELASSFALYYVGEVSAPTAVGSHTIQVRPTKGVAGYKYLDSYGEPTAVSAGDPISETTFTIVHENVSLFVPALDEVSSPTRSGTLYTNIMTGAKVILGTQTLTKDTDYTLSLERYVTDSYSPVVAIDVSGNYRLTVTFADTEATTALSRTSLTRDGLDPYVIRREFTVSDPATGLALAKTSIYEDDTSTAITLAAGKAPTVAYSTAIYREMNVGDTTLYSKDRSDVSNSYTGFEAGKYLYRVTFGADDATFGVKSGDIVDIPFTVKAIPFTVSFRVNGDYDLSSVIIDNSAGGDTTYFLITAFAITDGSADPNVFMNVEDQKFETKYYKYSDGTWGTSMSGLGKYKISVALKSGSENEVKIGDYNVKTDGPFFEKDISIVSGQLRVKPVNDDGILYFTNAPITNPLKFVTPSGEAVESSLIDGKYTLNYFKDSASIGSVQSVGHYTFVLTFNTDVEELSVGSGYVYCGEFDVVYPSFAVLYDAGAVSAFTQAGTLPLSKGTDYDITYYTVSNGNLFHKLGDTNDTPHPTAVGSYAAMIVFKSPYAVYNVKATDAAICFFENIETKAVIRIDASKLDKTYDGGVKLPPLTFTKSGADFYPVMNVDYSVSYFKKVGDDYVACGYPKYAGTYKCLVIFLKTGAEGSGVICGAFEKQEFVIKARPVKVTRKDKNDFVYDGEEKGVSVELRVNDRLFIGDHVFTYTLDATPVAHPTAVGTYSATLALDFGADPNAADLVKSYALSVSSFSLAIKPLELEVRYTVPTGYDAMYSGNVFEIDVKYIVKKGKYASDDPITAAALLNASKTTECPGGYLNIDEIVSYSSDSDSIVPVVPRDPDQYYCFVNANNPNVSLMSASACDQEGATIDDVASMNGDNARLFFAITPCKVIADFDLEDDLYYTGDEKGVESVSFKAYNASTKLFDRDLSDLGVTYVQETDYYIDYYSYTVTGAGNYVHDGRHHSTTPPTAKGKYYARLVFKDHIAEESKYTLVDGFDESGASLDHIRPNAYVDQYYSIKDQTELAAYVSVTNEFEGSVFYKIIDLSFVYRGSNFSAGITYDVSVTYGEDEVETVPVTKGLKVKRNDPGIYTVTFTFHRNTAYRITENNGKYDGQNNFFIAEGDTFVYSYNFIAQKELLIDWGSDPVRYYDGGAKQAAPLFEKETEEDVYSYVGMIEGTHYSLKYYQKVDAEYKLMKNGFPVDPGEYIAEMIFLEDLPDYRVNDQVILCDDFTSYEDEGASATFPRFSFSVEKAVLIVEGISVNDKDFDGTATASLNGAISFSAKDGCGAKVFEPTYTGNLTGHFGSIFPCAADATIPIVYDTKFVLTGESAKYYTIEYPSISAKILRTRVTVKPKEVRRQYDYSAVDNTIEYIVAPLGTIRDLFSLSSENDLISGELYRTSGISVGSYDILTDRLTFATDVKMPTGCEGKALSDLLELYVDLYDDNGDLIKYHITKRTVTGEIRTTSNTKKYNDDDPVFDESWIVITQGSLVSGDRIDASVSRVKGENVGYYDITATDLRVLNSVGADVSSNYVLTIRKGTFTIEAKRLEISPPNQNANYLEGFDPTGIGVWDPDADNGRGRTVTDKYVTDAQDGDHFIGKLSYSPKKKEDGSDDPFVYVIGRGTVRMVNAKGEDVSANYDLTFTSEERTFTITKVTINVKIKFGEIPSKYYGDAEPIIPFTISEEELGKLGRLTLSKYSSIGREGRKEGREDVGNYIIRKDNSEGSFIVLDSGKDVSVYFDFNVENMEENSKFFVIAPRPIIVSIEDATFENTGMDIRPNVIYTNAASGDRLSATLLSRLKVKYAAPTEEEFEYKKGVNMVAPIIIGEVTTDPNFFIETKEGAVTVVYLQDVVTAVAMPEDDEIYSSHTNILAGFMLYKPIRFYKLNTANGEQPSEIVDIALPIEKEFKGAGYVAVALYADGSPKAFALTQDGLNLLYEDDGAYYVAIAVVQEWFYIVLGVAAILIAVGLFFLVRLIVLVIKKHTAMTPEKEAKRAARQAAKDEKKRAKAVQVLPMTESQQAGASASDEVELDVPQSTEVPLAPSDDSIEIPLETSSNDDQEIVIGTPENATTDGSPAMDSPESPVESDETDLTDKTPVTSVFIPTAAFDTTEEDSSSDEEKKAQKKAQRELEKAQKKEKERAEKEAKERAKREKEEERLRREREKKAKKQNAASPNRPTAFIPTGAMSQMPAEEAEDPFKKSKHAQDTVPTDSDEIEIEIPSSDDSSSDDDLILSKSTSMFGDDEDGAPSTEDDENS